jgi:hypothetical protein
VGTITSSLAKYANRKADADYRKLTLNDTKDSLDEARGDFNNDPQQ